MLQEVDWSQAVKEQARGPRPAERDLREATRRGLLRAYAPTMQLNDWVEVLPKLALLPLPELHPATAEGVVAWANDPATRLDPELAGRIRRFWPSIAARADVP